MAKKKDKYENPGDEISGDVSDKIVSEVHKLIPNIDEISLFFGSKYFSKKLRQ